MQKNNKMISRITKIIFSMSLTGILLLIFAAAVGYATFIERDFGTETAKALIYNARWLEVLQLLLVINLIGSIFKYKMYRKQKWGIFLFHFAFILIFLGAAITRYTGYEGTMHIREGETSGRMNSMKSYLHIEAKSGDEHRIIEQEIFATPLSVQKINPRFEIGGKEVNIRYVKYFTGGRKTLEDAPGGIPVISLTSSGIKGGRKESLLKHHEHLQLDDITIGFDNEKQNDIEFFYRHDSLMFRTKDSLWRIDMQTQAKTLLLPDSIHPAEILQLYRYGGHSLVIKKFLPRAQITMQTTAGMLPGQGRDVIQYHISVGGRGQDVFVHGGKGLFIPGKEIELYGIRFKIRWGGKKIALPFAIHLNKFTMERYPGSNSPASYESFVQLIDSVRNVQFDYHIYMNHILNYDGYRLFQSSYDQDEKGTILSVNHDFWGTAVTYFGYFLMALGMLVSLLLPKGRFRILSRKFSKIREKAVLLLLFLLAGNFLSAATVDSLPPVIPETQAATFSTLLVQSHNGRIKPVHTFANELLRKITGKTRFEGQTPEQVILGMLVYPKKWQEVPMIKITHEGYHGLQKFLDTREKYISFHSLIDPVAGYKLSKAVQQAYAKPPVQRNKFDKEVIKVDEVVNIAYMVYQGELFRLFPVKGDPEYKWISPSQADQYFQGEEALFVKGILSMYLTALGEKDFKKASSYLEYIRDYQKKNAGNLYLSDKRIKAEIMYNKVNINFKLMMWYGILGFLLLILQFLSLLIPKIKIKPVNKLAFVLLSVLFLAQTLGMGVRWYISGHAPWSDSYESMVFIAWASIFAGLLFGRKSAFALSATAILSSLLLSVAMMAWVNPEITNLVPVLKSYWLKIHVATIITSYGFLGLGAFLALFNLLIINFKTKNNHLRLSRTVYELTIIIEMSLIVGLFLLSIGVFLGGIWANESWGRYWGWDSKETWSFVSMLVYAFVLHMRFIPGLKSKVAFIIASFFAFGTILMTYFGVNFILTGLHSYATGEGFSIPPLTYYLLFVFIILSVMAVVVEKKFAVIRITSA